jgi:hypothetical protein
MRTFLYRTIATILAIAVILWGADGLDATGGRLWLTYGAIALGSWLGYYALTGRTLLPERRRR